MIGRPLNSIGRIVRVPVLFMCLCAWSAPSAAQDTLLYVFGIAKDYFTGDTLKNYTVAALDTQDSLHVVPGRCDHRGRFDLVLNRQCTYVVEFTAPGFITKALEIDLHVPDSTIWSAGYGMSIAATLLNALPDLDVSAIPRVFGRAHYDPATDEFSWDMAYTEQARVQQAAVLRAYDERVRQRSEKKKP